MRLIWVVLLLLPSLASAHRFAPSLLQIDELTSSRYAMTWKTPLQAVSPVPLVPLLPEACSVIAESPSVQEGTGVVIQRVIDCAGEDGLVGQQIAVSGLAENQASVMLTLNLRDETSYQQVLTAAAPRYVIPSRPDIGSVVVDYSRLGAEHIWAGLDHLLFVFGLLLLVSGGRRLVLTITAFTLGHSVTLAMVTLGVFDYPIALVEFLIAVSIFVLALELSRQGKQSRLWRQPWWLAATFGLLHGMGFAGALAETGLPQGKVPIALLFFNIGIELGQLAFIAVLLVLWLLLKQLMGERALAWRPLPVYFLGALSAMWCIERGLAVVS